MKKQSNIEKAVKYDSLHLAIGMQLASIQEELKKDIPDSLQGSLRYWELGRRQALEQFAEILGRWRG